jgi:hypothetical protein
MNTLRTEFNNLVTSMKRYDLYQIDDEVGMGLQKLSDKIDEVYNRIGCVINTNKDCQDVISIYEDVISFIDLEILQRGILDINIALDLNDTEPITENWYGLFESKDVPRETWVRSQLANETDISVDDVVKVAMELGMNPSIEEINEVMGYYNSEAEQDSTATWILVVENLLYNCVAPSQQTTEDNVEHSLGGIPFRYCAECNIKEEEIVMTMMSNGVHLCCDCKDEYKEVVKAPTSLCETPQTHEFVKEVIAKLKVIGVDGETMQYILEQVGMDDQMLRQLVMKADFKDTKDLLREKFENEL